MDGRSWFFNSMLCANRDLVGGLRFIDKPKVLRFFVGRRAPASDWTAFPVEKFKKDLGTSL